MLNNCRVIRKPALEGRLRFRRLADANILDIGTSKNDIFVDFISRGDGAIGRPILCTK